MTDTFPQSLSFIPGTKIQFAWDSTSLGLFKTCPRKYYLTMIEDWRSRSESIHLTYGIAYHSALETYDREKFSGVGHEEACRRAVHSALLSTWKDGKPWNSFDTRKNRETLVRSIIWYLEHFLSDPCETVKLDSGKPAVELSFKLNIDLQAPNGESYLLTGHIDRLVRFNSDYYFMDRKTTTSPLNMQYFEQYSPDNQMSLYYTAARIVLKTPAKGGIIDAVQCASGFNRFQRGFISRTQSQIEDWLEETQHYILLAEDCAKREYWPMNDTSCSKFGGCPFRSVCGKDKSVRKNFLEADFVKFRWDPLKSREV